MQGSEYISDADALRRAHQFLWDEPAEASEGADAEWGTRLAKRYDAALNHEYALADLSRYKEGHVGLRWRTAEETFDGKGQFTCGATSCAKDESLTSLEVPFEYSEHGQRKQAMVKLRLCERCAKRLRHTRKYARRREEEEERARRDGRRQREDRRHKRRRRRHHHEASQ